MSSVTRAQLAERLGPIIGAARRADLSRYRRIAQAELALRYEDIKSWDKMGALLATPGVEFADGEEWIIIWVEEGAE